MLDRRRRAELEGVLALGRLADKLVLALGPVFRGGDLPAEDRPTVEAARDLFDRMTNEDVIVVRDPADRMLSDESYLDALQVVRAHGDVEPLARHYAELLQKVVDGDISDDERAELGQLRELFADVGDTTLARTNDLSRSREERSWRLMNQAISSF